MHGLALALTWMAAGGLSAPALAGPMQALLTRDAAGLGVFAEMPIEQLQLAQESAPRLVLDSLSRKFHTSGDWQTESTLRGKRGPTYVSAAGGTGDEQAVWVLDLPETGRYEVAVWYPQAANQATDAPFTVLHAGGATTVRINQQLSGGRWVKLGDFQFEARQGQVVLSNKIADPSRRVVADSIRVSRRADPGPRQ